MKHCIVFSIYVCQKGKRAISCVGPFAGLSERKIATDVGGRVRVPD